jgi:hypothetical protein
MSRLALEQDIASELARAQWTLERVAGLPKAFVRPTNVTPFFQPRILARSREQFTIDGYIGLVDRAFEAWWTKDKPSKTNFHCLALNVANVDVLRAAQYVVYGGPSSAGSFCNEMVRLLETMPQDENSLIQALNGGCLAGVSIEKYKFFDRDDKLRNLQRFASRLGSQRT